MIQPIMMANLTRKKTKAKLKRL